MKREDLLILKTSRESGIALKEAALDEDRALLALIDGAIAATSSPATPSVPAVPVETPTSPPVIIETPSPVQEPPPLPVTDSPKADPPVVVSPPVVSIPPDPIVVTPPHINLPALPSDVPTVFVAEIIPGYFSCKVHALPDPTGKTGSYLWVPIVQGIPQWDRIKSSGTAQLHGPFSVPTYNKSTGQFEFKEVRYPGLEINGVTDGEQGVLIALSDMAPGFNTYTEVPPREADEDDCPVFIIGEPLTEAVRGRIVNGHAVSTAPMPIVLGVSTLITLHVTGVTGTKALIYFEGFQKPLNFQQVPILKGTNPDDPQGVRRFLSETMEMTLYRQSDTFDKFGYRFVNGRMQVNFEDGGNIPWFDPLSGKLVSGRVGGTLYSGVEWKPLMIDPVTGKPQGYLVDLSGGKIWCFRVRYPAHSDGRRWWHQFFHPATDTIINNAFHNRTDAAGVPICPFSGGLGLTWAQLPEFQQIINFFDSRSGWYSEKYNGIDAPKGYEAAICRAHPRAFAIDQAGHESWVNELDCGNDYGHSMRFVLSQERCQAWECDVKRADIVFKNPLQWDKMDWRVVANLYHSGEEVRTVAPWDKDKPKETHSIEPELRIRNVEIGYMDAFVGEFAVREMTAFPA